MKSMGGEGPGGLPLWMMLGPPVTLKFPHPYSFCEQSDYNFTNCYLSVFMDILLNVTYTFVSGICVHYIVGNFTLNHTVQETKSI